MTQLPLFEGEQIISSSNDKKVTLTNQRLLKLEKGFGNARSISIHHSKISSVEIKYISWPWALIIGIFLLIVGLLNSTLRLDYTTFLGILIGTFFILLYFLSRRHLITITSDGGTRLNIQTKGMSSDDVLAFVNKMEYAKSLIK
ncbi:MAG: hypothetical protein IT236_18335 [Bacteroidia bacterium]|nr:hypothetical protein [Bacteroidia bacterium]